MSDLGRIFSAAVLVSGGGSTALNLIACAERGEIPIHIALIVAHRAEIPAVTRCAGAGRKVVVLPGNSSPAASDEMDELLHSHCIELVILGGYLRALRVGPWAGRALNIHPALLPAFGGQGMYGQHVHEAVIASGARESGCTVHFVDDRYDHGETIVQRKVPVLPNDSADSLAKRIAVEEHIAFPEAIRIWAARQH